MKKKPPPERTSGGRRKSSQLGTVKHSAMNPAGIDAARIKAPLTASGWICQKSSDQANPPRPFARRRRADDVERGDVPAPLKCGELRATRGHHTPRLVRTDPISRRRQAAPAPRQARRSIAERVTEAAVPKPRKPKLKLVCELLWRSPPYVDLKLGHVPLWRDGDGGVEFGAPTLVFVVARGDQPIS